MFIALNHSKVCIRRIRISSTVCIIESRSRVLKRLITLVVIINHSIIRIGVVRNYSVIILNCLYANTRDVVLSIGLIIVITWCTAVFHRLWTTWIAITEVTFLSVIDLFGCSCSTFIGTITLVSGYIGYIVNLSSR